jgi:hypothetical protein
LVLKAEEVWIFGPVSDGVLNEIRLAKKNNKPIRYFAIIDSKKISEIQGNEVEFEGGLEKYRNEL